MTPKATAVPVGSRWKSRDRREDRVVRVVAVDPPFAEPPFAFVENVGTKRRTRIRLSVLLTRFLRVEGR